MSNLRSMGQPSGLTDEKSGDNGGWQTGAAVVGVPGMGLEATGPDSFLTFRNVCKRGVDLTVMQ
jgi:hypothetical protein